MLSALHGSQLQSRLFFSVRFVVELFGRLGRLCPLNKNGCGVGVGERVGVYMAAGCAGGVSSVASRLRRLATLLTEANAEPEAAR